MKIETLIAANAELAFEIEEKAKRAVELVVANKELAFQIEEKEKRAAELVVAIKELAYQNQEKEKRAAELVVANRELAFQNEEKAKRAAELLLANKELAYQNQEKEKRAIELLRANKELESFTYISSHDLQEPLRKIQIFSGRILTQEMDKLSENGKHYFERIQYSALHMQNLIIDLLAYSRTSVSERKFKKINLEALVKEVLVDVQEELQEKNAIIDMSGLNEEYVNIIPFQFRQLMRNLISNSLKFSKSHTAPHVIIKSRIIKFTENNVNNIPPNREYCQISFSDNGIGIDSQYKDRIFEIFQQLHAKDAYSGTGMGLTIAKKIVENHNGVIVASGELGQGTTFDVYIPNDQDFNPLP